MYKIKKSLKIYINNPRQNLVLEDRPLVKQEGRIDVSETGKRIRSWLIQTNPKAAKFKEVTPRIFDIISRVTGLEPNYFPAINFVGLGRLLMKFNNEVLTY